MCSDDRRTLSFPAWKGATDVNASRIWGGELMLGVEGYLDLRGPLESRHPSVIDRKSRY